MEQLNNLSDLPKTWILDIDGVIFIHNYYLKYGEDKLVPMIKKLLNKIKKNDYIILLTARKKEYRALTLYSLKKFRIKYNQIIFDLPTGERILINDIKPNGLMTAISINVKRDTIQLK